MPNELPESTIHSPPFARSALLDVTDVAAFRAKLVILYFLNQ
jgi:hypothetical protein